MDNSDQGIIKKILIIAIFIVLAVATFLIIYPFLPAIFTAIFFAYLLRPVFKKLNSKINKPVLSSLIICLVVAIASVIFFILSIQIALTEITSFYTHTQTTDIMAPIKILFAKLSPGGTFPAQVSSILDKSIDNATTFIINYITSELTQVPFLLLQFFVFFFVLFYFIKDAGLLADYFKNVMPFRKKVRDQFFLRFRNITRGVIFGTIIAGAIDGVIVGLGLYIFNAPNPFFLTILSIMLGILPIVGPAMVWIPTSIIMLLSGQSTNAISLIVYCAVLPTIVSRVFMSYYVGKKASMSDAVALVGMLGGLKLLGLIGLVIGPLILDYFMLFIEFYRKGELKSLI